jgi:hypothetical protein
LRLPSTFYLRKTKKKEDCDLNFRSSMFVAECLLI